jgi:type IV pilus assembly protein PilX
MSTQTTPPRARQLGMALISGLLLLLVVTIIGISMFRSFGMQARIAGNTREKQRALHAAEGAQSYAEWWLASNGGINATLGNLCTGLVTDLTKAQVCSNPLPGIEPGNAANVPWGGSTPLGVAFTPPGGFSLSGTDAYFQTPVFYVHYLNSQFFKQSGTQINTYRIDAAAYGGTQNTVAVVESSYSVALTFTTSTTQQKFYSLTGP